MHYEERVFRGNVCVKDGTKYEPRTNVLRHVATHKAKVIDFILIRRHTYVKLS